MTELRKCFLVLLAVFAHGASAQSRLGTVFIRLWFTWEVFVDAKLDNASALVPELNPALPCVLYIHGFTESVESGSVKTVAQAYLSKSDHNMMALDYRQIADTNYVHAATTAVEVGQATRKAIDEMFAAGMDPETFHMIGHSLGAQVAGSIGRSGSRTLPRITGLDPAGPGFYLTEPRLSESDAKMVDIIHTDAGIFGIALESGTADYYPNGGNPVQPGCGGATVLTGLLGSCNHHRSWEFYAESVLNETAFPAVSCPSSTAFYKNLCSGNEITLMGIAAPATANGSYYLWTNAESPFGAGLTGVDPAEESENDN